MPNLHDQVRVRLTPHGVGVLTTQLRLLLHRAPEHFFDKAMAEHSPDAEGWTTWQLHELMFTFGRQLVAGMPSPFVDNEIRFVRCAAAAAHERDCTHPRAAPEVSSPPAPGCKPPQDHADVTNVIEGDGPSAEQGALSQARVASLRTELAEARRALAMVRAELEGLKRDVGEGLTNGVRPTVATVNVGGAAPTRQELAAIARRVHQG